MSRNAHRLSDTDFQRLEQYHDRWTAFGEHSGIISLSDRLSAAELRRYPIFADCDDDFLEKISPDVSVAHWRAQAILFEEGSYIDLAFFIIDGSVDIYLGIQQQAGPRSQPVFDNSRVLDLAQADQPRQRSASVFGQQVALQGKTSGRLTFLATMDFDLPAGQAKRLRDGDLFGEIGALNGWPQSATARTASECRLLQIRLPALRALKALKPAFAQHLNALYRERALMQQLQATPLFRHCSDHFLEQLKEKVELVSVKSGDTIAVEGEPAGALYLIRSGFLRLAQSTGHGELAVTYLSKGMTLGEVELLVDGIEVWQCTAIAVGHAELVRIARPDFTNLLRSYPEIEKALWQMVVARIKDIGATRRDLQRAELVHFALDQGLVEGTSMLLIDLSTCTRCDDCVKACADTHGGRPRFVREGAKFQQMQITRACYHCRDPVCLIGCPTGAIRRADVGEVVDIEESICIGCGLCASRCPYDAITMVATGEIWGDHALPAENRGQPRWVASKCDLCYTSATGPACVRNCPNGSAIRVGTLAELQTHLLER